MGSDEQQESIVTLPNLTKTAKSNSGQKNKALEKAIENKDLAIIQDFLVSDSKLENIKSLSKFYKSRLLPLLLEFLDQPLRIESIRCIYEILQDVGNVDAFSKVLIQRAVDFNKLVYLKGKIDYLKYLERVSSEDKVENEYFEDNLKNEV